MGNDKEYLFMERYRPQKVSECILSKDLKKTFQDFVDSGDFPNMILSGSAGVGKTTIAKAICNELNIEYMFINGSDERNIDTLRVKIKKFVSTNSLTNSKKAVIIDEADGLNQNSFQTALRSYIEEFSNCRFILTCNFKNKIIDPLHSRCTNIDFIIPREEKPKIAKELLERIKNILDENEIEYDQKVVVAVIKKYFPDFRRILTELQKFSVSGKIDSEMLSLLSDSSFSALLESLKEKNITKCRKWIVENIDNNIEDLIRWLYLNINEHMTGDSVAETIVILNEIQVDHNKVADPEINLMAGLIKIMFTVEWKD